MNMISFNAFANTLLLELPVHCLWSMSSCSGGTSWMMGKLCGW